MNLYVYEENINDMTETIENINSMTETYNNRKHQRFS